MQDSRVRSALISALVTASLLVAAGARAAETPRAQELLAEASRVGVDTAQETLRKDFQGLLAAYFVGQEQLLAFDLSLLNPFDRRELFAKDSYLRLLAVRAYTEDLRQKVRGAYEGLLSAAAIGVGADSRAARTLLKNFHELAKQTAKVPEFQLAALDLFDDLESVRATFQARTNGAGRRLVDSANAFRDLGAKREALLATLPSSLVERAERVPGQLRVAFTKLRELIRVRAEIESGVERIRADVGRGPASPIIAPGVGKTGNLMGDEFRDAGEWAITYDDGPSSKYTPMVLANLAKHKMVATFFELAEEVTNSPKTSLSVRDAGNEMACHSWTHAQLTKLTASPDKLRHETDEAVAFEAKIWERPVRFYRFPYGDGLNTPILRQKLATLGLVHVFWTVDTLDWQDKNPDSVFDRTTKQMKKQSRGIILFHDIHPQSVIASEKVMSYLDDHKLRQVTIGQATDEINGVVPTPTPDPVPVPDPDPVPAPVNPNGGN